MLITVKRIIMNNTCSIGELSIDDKFICYTLEDVVREEDGVSVDHWKVQNETAIPRGTYNVSMNFSNHFQKIMPLIENVLGFAGVRIHSGNAATDTEGCLLCGLDKNPKTNTISRSRDAIAILYPLIQAAIDKKEKVTLTIT